MKKVWVNHHEVMLPLTAGIAELIAQLGYIHSRGLAVAVNGNVVPKIHWENTVLNENDKITLIKATQGG